MKAQTTHYIQVVPLYLHIECMCGKAKGLGHVVYLFMAQMQHADHH